MTQKHINFGDEDVNNFINSAEGEAEEISLNMTRQEVVDARAFNNLPADMDLGAFVDKLFDDNFGSK